MVVRLSVAVIGMKRPMQVAPINDAVQASAKVAFMPHFVSKPLVEMWNHPKWGGGQVVPFLPQIGQRKRMRNADGLPDVLGRIGTLEVRLARTPSDIRRAQRLRYQVFYEEMAALPSPTARLARRDADAFDAICDHLLVLDYQDFERKPFRKPRPRLVGTYRLLRQEVAQQNFGFYTASEFEIAPLIARHPGLRFLELGRSCVLKHYRTKRTVELLWYGIWAYVMHHKIDAMFGCASLEGINPAKLALPLSFLHHHAGAQDDWVARALPQHRVAMDLLAAEEIDPTKALRALPPLIKGYLRLGARFGDGAVIDRQFGTTDVLVILPVNKINGRYIDHFGGVEADRFAA